MPKNKKEQTDSHRGEMTARLSLIPLKLAEKPYSLQELVNEFAPVSKRTIIRAIDALSSSHPITKEKKGRENYYQFMEGHRYVPPSFTLPELATLLLAQQSIVATGLSSFGTPFAGYGESLLLKVRAALPSTLRDKLDALSTIFGSAQVPAKDYKFFSTIIDQLTDAAIRQSRIKIDYYTLLTDKRSAREYDPYTVYFDPDGATLKVIGFDHNRKIILPLSIDHIRSITETGETFIRPKEWNLTKFLDENCFNGIHGEPIKVQLRAYGVTARVFNERKFHSSQKIITDYQPATINNEESITIELNVAQGRGLERFIMSWVPDIEVLAPAELRTKIAHLCQQANQRNSESQEK